MESASTCTLCPRRCAIDRKRARGVCGEGNEVRLARAALHFWEEPPISGESGSGTVFFSGCPLRCVYCQNKSIARGEVGRGVSIERLARIFLEQQERGALNINLVTPTHFATQIKAGTRPRPVGCVLRHAVRASHRLQHERLRAARGHCRA